MFAGVELVVSFMVIPVIKFILYASIAAGFYCRWFDGATISQLPGCGQLPIRREVCKQEKRQSRELALSGDRNTKVIWFS
jgi:hypothetical protein